MQKCLIAMGGLPGVGKSTLAERIANELGATLLSIDPIEAAIWRCGIPPSFETGLAAYVVAEAVAEQQLAAGRSAVIDAVNPIEISRQMWRELATRQGTVLLFVECVCPDLDLHRARVEGRQRNIPGMPEVPWERVQATLEYYEPWTDARITLDTTRPIAETLAEAMAYIRHEARHP